VSGQLYRSPIPIQLESRWAPEQVWAFFRKKKNILPLSGMEPGFLGRPDRSLVSPLTRLPLPLTLESLPFQSVRFPPLAPSPRHPKPLAILILKNFRIRIDQPHLTHLTKHFSKLAQLCRKYGYNIFLQKPLKLKAKFPSI
jgi:hypothetical protein